MPGLKSFLGRHKADYRSLEAKSKSVQAETILLDNRMRDVANASFPQRKLTIHCWPSTDSLDRLWGHYGRERDQAAIMHFRMQAQHEENLKVVNFELSIMFKVIEASDAEEQAGLVALINNPCPDKVEASDRSGSIPQRIKAPWRFWSQTIGNPSPGATWIWKSDVSETPILHGGVAVLHSGRPFCGQCRVRGEVRRSRRTFKFDNINHGEKVFRVNPEVADLSLDEYVRNLNEDVKARFCGNASGKPKMRLIPNLLTNAAGRQSKVHLSGPSRGSADYVPIPGPEHMYSSRVIQGHAQVHMGNANITNYNWIAPAQQRHVQPLSHGLPQEPVTEPSVESRLTS